VSIFSGILSGGEKRLIEAYHATKVGGIKQFRAGKDDIGVHFGTMEQAEDRVEQFSVDAARGGEVYFIYNVDLALENPLRLYDTGEWKPVDVARRMLIGSTSKDPESAKFLSNEEVARIESVYAEGGDAAAREALVGFIVARGYVSVVYINRHEGHAHADSYIVFDPKRVKNHGAMTVTSPDPDDD
jgi:hypothetical protein